MSLTSIIKQQPVSKVDHKVFQSCNSFIPKIDIVGMQFCAHTKCFNSLVQLSAIIIFQSSLQNTLYSMAVVVVCTNLKMPSYFSVLTEINDFHFNGYSNLPLPYSFENTGTTSQVWYESDLNLLYKLPLLLLLLLHYKCYKTTGGLQYNCSTL